METIYLVGQISPKFEETYLWRKKVTEELKGKFNIIDPCSNNFNSKLLEDKKYAVNGNSREFGIDVLVPKDLTSVLRSDIAIVNLNQYDPSKPLLGSFFELAWYYMYPEKTVIGFAKDLNDYKCQHPFVQQAVNAWCHDEEQVCYLVEKYFTSMDDC